MSIRKVNFVGGEYYHIYNRGNSKQKIFIDEKDYKHFVRLLYLSNTEKNFRINDISRKFFSFERGKQLVSLASYCLMPNHFHILITENTKGGITKFMQKLSTAYSMYYNKKYERSGSLFEGKFKSQYIGTNNHLKYLFSYIHLNPIKLIQRDWKERGIRNKIQVLKLLKNYKYSSYLDFMGEKRPQNKILNLESFPNYFPTEDKFKKEIFEWLSSTH